MTEWNLRILPNKFEKFCRTEKGNLAECVCHIIDTWMAIFLDLSMADLTPIFKASVPYRWSDQNGWERRLPVNAMRQAPSISRLMRVTSIRLSLPCSTLPMCSGGRSLVSSMNGKSCHPYGTWSAPVSMNPWGPKACTYLQVQSCQRRGTRVRVVPSDILGQGVLEDFTCRQ